MIDLLQKKFRDSIQSPNPIPVRKISARYTFAELDVERRFLSREKPEHGRGHRLHRDLKGGINVGPRAQ